MGLWLSKPENSTLLDGSKGSLVRQILCAMSVNGQVAATAAGTAVRKAKFLAKWQAVLVLTTETGTEIARYLMANKKKIGDLNPKVMLRNRAYG